MSKKVTNIYIDVTGFCDAAKGRVHKALDTIAEYNAVDVVSPSTGAILDGRRAVFFDENGMWWTTGDIGTTTKLNGKNQVGLWELESIASQCKGDVETEPLPTRNICIDARTLTKEQRRDAFAVIRSLAPFSTDWYAPPNGDSRTMRDADFILYDIFAIDKDGDRVFIDNEINQTVSPFLVNPKELTYWELMSLAHA